MRTETDERILGEESFSRSRRRFEITRTSSDATDICCIRRQHRLCTAASIDDWKSKVDCVIVIEVGELRCGADSISDPLGGLHRTCLIAESRMVVHCPSMIMVLSEAKRLPLRRSAGFFFLFFFFFATELDSELTAYGLVSLEY